MPFRWNYDEALERLRRWRRTLRETPVVRWRPLLGFWASIAFALLVYAAAADLGLDLRQRFMLGIFALAAVLWVTEALPLFATALLVISLEIIFLANPGGWAFLDAAGAPSFDYRQFLAPIADPVLVLFFGGLVLAQAIGKQGLGSLLAAAILGLFRGHPALVMLGLMGVTALFSTFMSNTATTAMMITIVTPILARIPADDPMRKGLLLAIPLAANIGGMSTPISSPPNAVAVGYLRSAGHDIRFLEWVVIAVPLMIGLLAAAWLLLWLRYRPAIRRLSLAPMETKLTRHGWFVMGVTALTVLLWLTDGIHGLPTAVVALLPVVAFTSTRLLRQSDINNLDWDLLILIAGGIALGHGMNATALDQAIAAALPLEAALVLPAMVAGTLAVGTFMSNTGAANLILPIGVSLAVQGGGDVLHLGLAIALTASLGMSLPVSTPPNAIAYSRGELRAADFLLTGGPLGVLGVILIILFIRPIVDFWTG